MGWVVPATPQPLYPWEGDLVHIARKTSPPQEFDPWTVQPVGSCCTA